VSADAIGLAAHRLVGLSWGDEATRRDYSRLLAPWDSEERAVLMAGEQSSCALVVAAVLLIAEVDGMVRGWRGKVACDPLREPRWQRYDSVAYLEQLARQRGVYRGAGRDLPDLRPGVWWRVGGQRGDEHVGLVVEGPDREGWLTCVEGGQQDPLNPRPGSKGCTRIALKRRKVTGSPGRWILADRPLGYTADATNLPCLTSGEKKGMPWATIGVKP
jgi:hypothetical protein